MTNALSRPSRPSYESAAMPGHLPSTEVETDEGNGLDLACMKRPICLVQDEAFGVLHQVIAGLSVDSIAASLQAASRNASTSFVS